MKTVPLSTSLGEVMAPQTLLTVLILSPDGTLTVDPGALHGRSEVESTLHKIIQAREPVPNTTVYWLIWVAVELDGSNTPIRYKGIAASELWIDHATKTGYKILAEHVNRMAEAMRGGVNLKTLDHRARLLIAKQLESLGAAAWGQSPSSLKEQLT